MRYEKIDALLCLGKDEKFLPQIIEQQILCQRRLGIVKT